MSSYPQTWTITNLFEVCQPRQWKTISTKELTQAGYTVYGANGVIGFYNQYTHEAPTLMITCRGATCGNLHISKPFSYINGNAMALDHLNESICSMSYLHRFLQARGFDDVISGSAQPQITQEGLRKVDIPIAPRQEQKRIADKLDTVLTRVDAVNTRLARVAPLLKRFRQSVLAAATSGRLTADLNGGAVSAPVELGDLCNVYGGKRLPKGFQLSDFDTGFPYVRVTDFDSFSVKTDQLKYVPEEAAREISRYIINASDVYISIAGSIGLVGQVPVAIDGANLTENAARIVPNKKLRPVFLMYQLASPQLQEQMHEKKIATTQDKLGLFRIKSLNIWLPGLDEQTEIVRRVETLFAFADRLEARLAQAQTAATRLTPALLAKAFRGELVPQDPNDEPAAELLRRLQAERATAPKASAGRGRKAVVQS